MVYYWITNYNTCQEFRDFILTRPPQSDPFTAVNIAISVILSVLMLLGCIWWFTLKNEPWLTTRPMISTFYLTLAFFLTVWVVAIRRSAVDETGHPNMSCHLQAFLWLATGPAFVIGSLLRAIYLANRVRFTETVARRKRIDIHDDSDQSASDHQSQGGRSRSPLAITLKSLFIYAFGYEKQTGPDDVSTVGDGVSDERLRMLAATSSTRAFVYLILLFLVPNMVVLAIYFAVVPIYHENCTGCDISYELLIAANISTPFSVIASIRVRKMLVGTPDPEGVLTEMKLSEKSGYVLFVFTCFIMLGVDPGLHDWENRVSYEWFDVTAFAILWFILVPLQLIRAREAKNAREAGLHRTSRIYNSRVLSNDLLFETIKHPTLGPKFEKYAEDCLVLESIRFLQDALAWKLYFDERSEAWRKKKADMLNETYIRTNAPLQVNISSADRDSVEQGLSRRSIEKSLFDDAINSVALMIRQGAFLQFSKTDVPELNAKLDNIIAIANTSETV
jgi:hypothetical protein